MPQLNEQDRGILWYKGRMLVYRRPYPDETAGPNGFVVTDSWGDHIDQNAAIAKLIDEERRIKGWKGENA